MRKLLVVFVLVVTAFSSYAQAKKAPAKTVPIDPGKKVYEEFCLSCHQEDGMGVSGMNPPLSQTEWVSGDKTRLIKTVLNGMQTPIQINGESFHNPMPSHAFLTDQQIADVLTYIRSNFGNKYPAVTAAEVKTARASK